MPRKNAETNTNPFQYTWMASDLVTQHNVKWECSTIQVVKNSSQVHLKKYLINPCLKWEMFEKVTQLKKYEHSMKSLSSRIWEAVFVRSWAVTFRAF